MTSQDNICPKHSYCRVNNGNPDAIMHFCGDDPIDEHDKRVIQARINELIEKTKNYGIVKKPDGSTTIGLTLSFRGSIRNAIESNGRDNWGANEAVRLYVAGREAWLRGDFETVADLFGVLV